MNHEILNNRLKKELMNLERDPPPGISCYPKEDKLTDLEAYIRGPPDSPYEKGIFKLTIQIPQNYPFDPPQIRFVTSIYHPNIDDAGRICADILKKGEKGGWKPALNLSTTLILLSQLLADPNPDDPLDADIAKEFQLDYPTYKQKAIEYTKKYATEEASITESTETIEKQQIKTNKKTIDELHEEQAGLELDSIKESRKPKLSLSLSKTKGSSQNTSSQSLTPSQSFTRETVSLTKKLSSSTISDEAKEDDSNSPKVYENKLSNKKTPPSTKKRKNEVLTEKDNVKEPSKSKKKVKVKEDKKQKRNIEEKDTRLPSPVTAEKKLTLKVQQPNNMTDTISDDSIQRKSESMAISNDSNSKNETIPEKENDSSSPFSFVSTNSDNDDTQQSKVDNITLYKMNNGVIVISDDDDENVLHSLQLSKKLKRNKLSLSKRKN